MTLSEVFGDLRDVIHVDVTDSWQSLPEDPRDERYIYLHESHTNQLQIVGRYTSSMDCLGDPSVSFL